MQSSILQPVVALVLWSFVMQAWLYATRMPAMVKAKVPMDPTKTTAELSQMAPAPVRWVADNYNHLMEQPTIFYATAPTLALAGLGDRLNAALAWAYVGLRVVHSLVQVSVNIIMLRWAVFTISSLVLLTLAVGAALAVF